MNHQEKGMCCGECDRAGVLKPECLNPTCPCHSQKAEKECLYGGKCTHGQCPAPTTDTAEKEPVTNVCMMPDTYSFKEVPSTNTTEKILIVNSKEYTDAVLEGFTKAVDNVFIPTTDTEKERTCGLVETNVYKTHASFCPKRITDTSDVEALSAQLHDIYMKEARRQGDVRHAAAYADLPEHVKEFDRVLARSITTLLEQDREESYNEGYANCARNHKATSFEAGKAAKLAEIHTIIEENMMKMPDHECDQTTYCSHYPKILAHNTALTEVLTKL